MDLKVKNKNRTLLSVSKELPGRPTNSLFEETVFEKIKSKAARREAEPRCQGAMSYHINYALRNMHIVPK